MLDQVLASFLQSNEVLLSVSFVQRLSRGDIGSSTVHLESTGSSDDDGSIRLEATGSALDVAEFFHSHVSSETTLSQDIADAFRAIALLGTRQFKGDLVSENGRVSVGDVGERSSVDKDGGTLWSHCQ